MSELDAAARQLVTPLLRQGEQIQGVGVLENWIPLFARLVPIVRSSYRGPSLVVGTGERLFFFPTTLSALGNNAAAPRGRPEVLELSRVRTATPFGAVMIGKLGAFQIERRDGIVHKFMIPAEVKNLPEHRSFGEGFPAWLGTASQARAIPERAPDPNLAEPMPPSLAQEWYFTIVGGLSALLLLLLWFSAHGDFAVRVFGLVPAFAAAALALLSLRTISTRKKLLTLSYPERVRYVEAAPAPPAIVRPARAVPIAGAFGLVFAVMANYVMDVVGGATDGSFGRSDVEKVCVQLQRIDPTIPDSELSKCADDMERRLATCDRKVVSCMKEADTKAAAKLCFESCKK